MNLIPFKFFNLTSNPLNFKNKIPLILQFRDHLFKSKNLLLLISHCKTNTHVFSLWHGLIYSLWVSYILIQVFKLSTLYKISFWLSCNRINDEKSH